MRCSAVKRYSQQQTEQKKQKDDTTAPGAKKSKEGQDEGVLPGSKQLKTQKHEGEKGQSHDALGGDKDKVSKLRVVAYSDSDSDVEDHFEKVKTHLLPAIEKLDIKADGAKKREDEKSQQQDGIDDQQTKKAAGSIAVGQLLSKIATIIFGNVVTGPVIVGGLILSGIERKVHPQAPILIEAVGGSLFALKTVLSLIRGRPLAPSTFDVITKDVLMSSIVFESFKWIRRRRTPLYRIGSHIDLKRLASTDRPDLGDRSPKTMNDFAAVYNPELREIQRILKACDIPLPDRFDDDNEEIFRFAKSCGLLEAENTDDRAKVVERAVRKIIQTVEVIDSFERLSETRLARWERVVSWRGIDSSGHPVLVVRLGRALQLSNSSASWLEKFVTAIKSQVDIGIKEKMKDSPMGTMIVVVDCREITTWDAISNSRQISTIAKSLASFFATHYPERLERAYLIDVSMMVSRMLVSSIVSSLHPGTKAKIIQTTSSDESLPVTLASLQKTRSFAAGLSSRLSDPSLETSVTSHSGDNDDIEAIDDEYHTPYTGLAVAEDESAPQEIGSHVLVPTPLSDVSIRGRLFSNASSIDSIDLASHLSIYPWSGLDLILVLLWQSPINTQKQRRAAISPTSRKGGIGFSRENSFCSIESPRALKGGLSELPPRKNVPSSHMGLETMPAKTSSPCKPSLRREGSTPEEHRPAATTLGSYPLPRQSSVSWAETLVNVREIDSLGLEMSDERVQEYVRYYLVCLLLTARVISACLVSI